MIKSESGIRFEFSDDYAVVKYDDTRFHQLRFNKLPGSKGVDFLAANDNAVLFIEVKNCAGHEADNRWRIAPNNKKRDTIPTDHDVSDRDSLDIEIPQKVAMTMAALAGVYSRPTPYRDLEACEPIAERLFSEDIHAQRKRVYVILVLEGAFANGLQTRDERFVREGIRRCMERHLQWLRCVVKVIAPQELERFVPGIKAEEELSIN